MPHILNSNITQVISEFHNYMLNKEDFANFERRRNSEQKFGNALHIQTDFLSKLVAYKHYNYLLSHCLLYTSVAGGMKHRGGGRPIL